MKTLVVEENMVVVQVKPLQPLPDKSSTLTGPLEAVSLLQEPSFEEHTLSLHQPASRIGGSDMMRKKAREPKYSSAVHRSQSLRELLLVSQLRKRERRIAGMVQVWVSMYCWLEREGCLECGRMTGLRVTMYDWSVGVGVTVSV
ncbi:hypothetical protein O3P69_010964 [Scylla paramamosain]|uniref:Uncharacterized protein n=1 Tax=Scylla paramamosain TaxID=85552 RepID=A0AAW0SDS2_SCYPA